MLKQEFEEMVDQKVTEDEYIYIERVYLDYPTLVDIEKSVFVYVFKAIGMIGIMDLYQRAQKIHDLDEEISLLTSRKKELESNR